MPTEQRVPRLDLNELPLKCDRSFAQSAVSPHLGEVSAERMVTVLLGDATKLYALIYHRLLGEVSAERMVTVLLGDATKLYALIYHRLLGEVSAVRMVTVLLGEATKLYALIYHRLLGRVTDGRCSWNTIVLRPVLVGLWLVFRGSSVDGLCS